MNRIKSTHILLAILFGGFEVVVLFQAKLWSNIIMSAPIAQTVTWVCGIALGVIMLLLMQYTEDITDDPKGSIWAAVIACCLTLAVGQFFDAWLWLALLGIEFAILYALFNRRFA